MQSNRRLEFTAAAEDDIVQILQYTHETWGDAQLLQYSADLDRSFDLLVRFPNLGKHRVGDQVFSHRTREHVIYYSVRENTLLVRRVLHKNQDAREASLAEE